MTTLFYDSDIYPEFATIGWMDIKIFDDNGSQLVWNTFKWNASSRLPFAILDDKIVSYYVDSYDYSNNGLMFMGGYVPFYTISNIEQDSLAAVDTNNDGKNDVLFGISNYDTLFKLDKDGNEIFKHALGYDSAIYLWGGKLNNGTPLVVVGTNDGQVHALDMNGLQLWSQTLSSSVDVVKIKKDKDGGLIILTNNDSIWHNGTQNVISKIDENNGSILWQYSSGSSITKALTQDSSMIAAGFESGFKIFDENGTILHEANISEPSYDNSLDVHALQFGTMGDRSGIFVGTLDINMFNSADSERIYSGGTLVQNIASGDMNGDGQDEIVLQDENRLYLYNSSGTLLWTKNHYVLFQDVHFADLTGDGKQELIAGADGKIIVLNYNGDEIWSKSGYYSNIYPSIELYDYDGDGLKDLFTAGLDYDTQKYNIVVSSGKTGATLHEFGTADDVSSLKVLEINGLKQLYYTDYSSLLSLDFNATTNSAHYKNFSLSYNSKLNDFKDVNGDGIVDIITAYNQNDTSLVLNFIDLTDKDQYGYVQTHSMTITVPDYVKMVKFYDYNHDGTYEVLLVFAKGIYLYDLNGNQIWKKEMSDEFGHDRMLSDVKIVDDTLFVSGKELYILNNNGEQVQAISPPSYMSTSSYYLPTSLAKISSSGDMQVIIGAMGIYSYTGVALDNTKVPKLNYRVGWNLVATPINKTVPLSAIDGLSIAWDYNNGIWSVHTTTPSDTTRANNLGYEQFDAIVPTKGVWIKTSSSGELTLPGIANATPALHVGWNLIGGIATTADAIHTMNENVDIIWKYTDQDTWKGRSYIMDVPLETLTTISASEGFWVHVKQ